MSPEGDLLLQAEKVATLLASYGIPALLIGAGAMAVHHHVRMTRDVDLGVAVPFKTLLALESPFREAGWQVEFRPPGIDDPLDGVVDVLTRPGLVQIVNFGNTFPAVIDDALLASPLRVTPQGALRVIPLPFLIIMKIYAGGRKSQIDILELLSANPDTDRASLLALCKKYRLGGLEPLLEEQED